METPSLPSKEEQNARVIQSSLCPNLAWYISNFEKLKTEHKDKSGQFCVICNEKVFFLDESCKTIHQAAEVMKKEYPELKPALILWFEVEPASSVVDSTATPSSKPKRQIVENKLKFSDNFLKNFEWISENISSLKNKCVAVYNEQCVELEEFGLEEAYKWVKEHNITCGAIILNPCFNAQTFANGSGSNCLGLGFCDEKWRTTINEYDI